MSWKENPQVKAFLEQAHTLNDHNAVRAGEESKPLHHSFWDMSEIEGAADLQDEWDVAPALVPFYGDWHTLICVDMGSSPPSVVLLNDERSLVSRWETLDAFRESLETLEEEPSSDLGVIEEKSWLNF